MGIKLKAAPSEAYAEWIAKEVEEYDVPGLELDKPTILDIGANIGAFTVWALERWPTAVVTCYEPVPANFEMLKSNVMDAQLAGELGAGAGVHHGVQNVAVTSDGQPLTLLGGQNAGTWSRHVLSGRMGDSIQVRAIAASTLPPCEVLKLDTEGCELEILRGYRHLDACKAVLLEWHRTEDIEPIRALLTATGFSLYGETGPSGHETGTMRWVKTDLMPERAKTRLFLAVPGWNCSQYHAQSREMLLVECARRGVELIVHPDRTSGLERARNISVAMFLATDSTHLLFCDADIAFRPDDIFEMVETGFPLIGVPYAKKGFDFEYVAAAVKAGVKPEHLREYSGSYVYNDKPNQTKGFTHKATGRRYLEVDTVGTGLMLIKREVIVAFLERWYEETAYITDYDPKGHVHHNLFDHERDPDCDYERSVRALRAAAAKYALRAARGDGVNAQYDLTVAAAEYALQKDRGPVAYGRYLTEDYSFCRRWQMMGGKVMLAIDATTAHQGPFVFEGQASHMFPRGENKEAAE